MIKMSGSRRKGTQVIEGIPPEHLRPVERAFESLVRGELSFGGRVKEVSPTRLVIETSVAGGHTVDTTCFEGPSWEMVNLVAIACAYEKVMSEKRGEIAEKAYENLKEYGEKVSGSALFVTHLCPILMGNHALEEAAKLLMEK